jgi:translation initiation factor IF-3
MRGEAIKTKSKTRINREIRASEVRLIDAAEQQLGVVSFFEALKLAEEANLDLVEISPNAAPPVCRIMDFGKFQFQQGKKLSEAKKKQKQVQLKEIKFRPGIEEGDYQVKLKNLIRFLTEGDKVKITLRYRGREVTHQEIGAALLNRVKEELLEHSTVEQYPRMEGRQMVMLLGPKKK